MKLQIVSAGKTWEFLVKQGDGGITVGHRPGNDIVLPDDAGVSNMHLRIDRFLHSWSFTDQMSDSGTLHNGRPASTGDLADGDELKVGDSLIRVLSLDEGTAPPSTNGDNQIGHKGADAVRVQTQRYSTPREQTTHRGQASRDKKPPGLRLPLVAFMVVLAVGGIIAASVLGEQESQEQDLPSAQGDAPNYFAEPEAPAPDQVRAYRDALRELRNESDQPIHERLAEVEGIRAKAEEIGDSGLIAYARSAVILLKGRLSRDLSARYTAEHAEINSLRNSGQFAEAQARLAVLARLMETSPHHAEWASNSRVDSYIEEETTRIAEASTRWTHQQLELADTALYRNAFADAAAILRAVLAQAVLDGNVRSGLSSEADTHEAAADRQSLDEIPPPREPFNPETDRLPPAAPSAILPQGENSSLRNEVRLRQRLTRVANTADFKGLDGLHWGRSARLVKSARGAMTLTVARPLPGLAEFHYTVVRSMTDLPALTRVSLYEQLPDLSQNERVGILMLCFDHGLIDEAARVACDLWKAHPDTKPALDALLATKLRIGVPDGGFIERDGRLVAPD